MDGLEEMNELDEYLAQPIEKVRNPIGWWWDHRAMFPYLSIMALDYLSVPGKSGFSGRKFLLITSISYINCC